MTLLIWAIIGVVACIAQALNITVQMILAALDHGKITLDFSHFNEIWFELPISIVVFILGIWGFFYLMGHIR